MGCFQLCSLNCVCISPSQFLLHLLGPAKPLMQLVDHPPEVTSSLLVNATLHCTAMNCNFLFFISRVLYLGECQGPHIHWVREQGKGTDALFVWRGPKLWVTWDSDKRAGTASVLNLKYKPSCTTQLKSECLGYCFLEWLLGKAGLWVCLKVMLQLED